MFLNYLLRLISLNHSPKFLSYQKKKKIDRACLSVPHHPRHLYKVPKYILSSFI